jgi:hypothetical protein
MNSQRPLTNTALIIALAIGLGVMLYLGTPFEPAEAAQPRQVAHQRHLGYGINVGPHLKVPPTMLTELGLDWVKIYDLNQVDEFPDQHILYRTDVRGYPSSISAWEQEMVKLANRLELLGVEAVEIGNEPNLIIEWGNQPPNAREYADALCRGYRIFKKTAPDIVVVSAGLAPTDTRADGTVINDLEFAQQMINAGAGRCFDVWGYHPYGFNQPPESDPYKHEMTFRRTERMVQLLEKNGLRNRQLWLTEFGWVRNPAEEGLDCRNDHMFRDFQWMIVSKETQANYIVRAYQYAEANWPWAGPMFLWNLNWQSYSASYEPMCSHLRWFSILQTNGSPLPAYTALQKMKKYPPLDYGPTVGITGEELSRTVEAGCAGITDMGSFTITNHGYPGSLRVEIKPANGPGLPTVWTSTYTATPGTTVDVLVDAKGVPPGLYMIGINVRSVGTPNLSSVLVQGWLIVQNPTSEECISRYNQQMANNE